MNRSLVHASIYFYSLLMIVVTMPFFVRLNSFFVIILVLNWFIEGDWKNKWKRLIQAPYAVFLGSFYLLHVLGLLYTTNIQEGLFELEKKLSLLVFPIILATSHPLEQAKIERLLKYFVLACTVAMVVCLGNAMYQHFFYGDSTYYYYHKLGSFLNFHAVYFSFYLCFSLFILVYFLHKNYTLVTLGFRTLLVSLIVFTLFFILLLSSKTIIGTLFIFIVAYILSLFVRLKKISLGIFLVILMGGVLCMAIFNLSMTKDRFQEVFHEDYKVVERNDYRGVTFTGGTIRYVIWKTIVEILNEKNEWILGVGTGDGQYLLTQNYMKKNIYPGDEKLGYTGFLHYNAHNQYFQFLLTLGFTGLIYFLICLIFQIWLAFRNKNYLFAACFVLFAIFSVTESTLCAHKGVIFYFLFTSIFAFHAQHNKLK